MPPPPGKGPWGANHRAGLDPKWAQVDQYTLSHLHPASKPNHSHLTTTLSHSAAQHLPPIYSSPSFGKFLALQARILNAKHALEVGTLGGYAAIWLASENPELRVTTIEYDARHAEVARENIERAGLSERVQVRVGKGMDVLPQMLREVEEGRLPRVDLSFIDADKVNNWNYMDLSVKMSRPGSVVMVDNVVQRGEVVSEDPEVLGREHVMGAREVIERAGKDERVDAMVMQQVCERNYDGFVYAVVR